MKTAHFLTVALTGAAFLALAGPAAAQDDAMSRRIDRMEKDLREVRSIVLQARATGQPVQIRTASSDDQVAAIQSRLDDLEQTLRGLTGQVETLSHDDDVAKQDQAASQALVAALADRVDKLEKQAVAVAAAPPPPAPDASAQNQPPATVADPKAASAAYVKARQLLLDGDYPAAADALQNFLDTYPASSSAQAAHYWLGGVKYTLGDYQAAAGNLVAAIRGWPHTPWAPDAMIKLSLALTQLNKTNDACATLGALPRHYPGLPTAVRVRAKDAKVKAGCAA